MIKSLFRLCLRMMTGLKFLGEGGCKRKKHQPEYRHQWRKLHIDIDAKKPTNTSCSVHRE